MTEAMSPASLLAAGRDALIEAAFFTGDFGGAYFLLEEARSVALTIGDMQTLAGALDQLGFLQHWKNIDLPTEDREVDAEIELFERALALRLDLDDDAGTAESLFHVGLAYQLFKREWETAQVYLERALLLAEKSGDIILLSEIHRHIGAYYWAHKRDFDAALMYLRESLDLRETTGISYWIASGLITLGQCELAANQPDLAIEHLQRGIEIAESNNLREMWALMAKDALNRASQS